MPQEPISAPQSLQGEAEEWQEIPGFPDYHVSSLGRVRSRRPVNGRGPVGPWRLLRGNRRKDGYWRVLLTDGVRMLHADIHRLVLLAFVRPPTGGEECCHADGSRDNNRLANLRWGTPKDNAADRGRHGTQQHGEGHQFARLPDAAVLEIRRLRKSGVHAKVLATRFNTTPEHVSEVCRGNSRRYLKPPAGATYLTVSAGKVNMLRWHAGWSIKELGRRAGIDASHVNRVLRGRKHASWRTVAALAAALGVAPEALCDERPLA